jgi:hypothetical protein
METWKQLWTIRVKGFDWGIFESQEDAERCARLSWGTRWAEDGRKAIPLMAPVTARETMGA